MNLTNRLLLLFPLLLCASLLQAQFQGTVYIPDTSATITAYNKELLMGWGGGFNAPQFAIGDLNNDGKKDLVVYEKGSIQVRTFINYGDPGDPKYRYRPQYEKHFPIINEYLKLEDYNCDEVPDLIHRGQAGFSIWRGAYNAANELTFTHYKDIYYSPLSAGGEGFEASAFPPASWQVIGIGWNRHTSGSNPFVTPYTGNAMAGFSSMSSSGPAYLVSRRLRISPNLGSGANVSLWMYRNNTAPAIADSISVYVSNNPSPANAVYINRIARSRSINQPDTQPVDGWYHYTFSVPAGFYGDSVYFILKATGHGGNNMFVDNIAWITSNMAGDINAYVEPNDIPGVADIDGDGDLDFFAHSIMGMYVGFYKNYQVEYGLPCDSITVNLKEGCWGKTFQGYERTHTLGIASCPADPNPMPQKPSKTTHAGNTLCFLDMDGDGDYDYLNGNVSFADIQYLENGKADFSYVRDTIISQDTTWPKNGTVLEMELWPKAFWLDIDQDGDKDLLFSPHTEGASENYNCIKWYENTGSDANPDFQYRHDSLFVSSTIDLGIHSHPLLYDYDKDGKPDLFIGGEGLFAGGSNLRAKMAYYKNTSSVGHISFELQDNDFAGLFALNIAGAVPAVGDLDNDGKDDLLIGHSDGTISFYKNMAATATVQPDWQLTHMALSDINNVLIDSSGYAAPFIYDIDNDGKKDLLIGGRSGYLYFYKNTGTGSGVLQLTYQTNKLGMAKADPHNLFDAYAAPFIGKIDNSGKDFLMLGSNSGRIYRYTGFQNGNVTAPYTLVDSIYSLFRQEEIYKYYGYRSTLAFDDIDGDGMYDLVMGNVLGGVRLFNQHGPVSIGDITAEETTTPCIVYPNPAYEVVHIRWEASFASRGEVKVALYTISGQQLKEITVPATQGASSIATANLAPGTYLCVVSSAQGDRQTSRVVLMK